MRKSGRARRTGSHLYHKINIFSVSDIASWFYNNDDDKERSKLKPVAVVDFAPEGVI